MKKRRVYLDTSVFIAEFDKKDARHASLTAMLMKLKKIEDVELCSSKWALTEMCNRLTKNKIDELKIIKYFNDLIDKCRIRGIKLKILDVSPKENYDFNLFFSDMTKDLIKYKTGKDRPGLGDIIHVRIMKNNRVSIVMSFDAHFDKIRGFTCINPQTTKVGEEAANTQATVMPI